MVSTEAFYAIGFAALLLGVYILRQWGQSSRRTPPGPRPWPIIGNLLDIPASHEWFTFAKWGETYGELEPRHHHVHLHEY